MNVQTIKPQMNFTSKVICKDEKGKKVDQDSLQEYANKNLYKYAELSCAKSYLEEDGKSDVYEFSKSKDGKTIKAKYPDGGKFQMPVFDGVKDFIDCIIAAGKESAKEDGDNRSFSIMKGDRY